MKLILSKPSASSLLRMSNVMVSRCLNMTEWLICTLHGPWRDQKSSSICYFLIILLPDSGLERQLMSQMIHDLPLGYGISQSGSNSNPNINSTPAWSSPTYRVHIYIAWPSLPSINLPTPTVNLQHICPEPEATSGCRAKQLGLFLRIPQSGIQTHFHVNR